MDAIEAVVEAMARFAYEDAYPGKPWGMADGFTHAMFRDKCAYYAPAALAAARPFIAAEWQPIETAPKDGSHILLAWSHNNGTPPRVSECFWRSDMPFSNGGIWWCFHGRMFADPTHWQPLPAPPTAIKETIR